ncbi:MAG: hypothetical protein Q8O67_34230 [Deltaproteobacteria bacterium]|nr:hypothetical protein [Deltaproteobacteria bacterium]
MFNKAPFALLLLLIALPASANDDDDDPMVASGRSSLTREASSHRGATLRDDREAVFRAWPGLGVGHKFGGGVLAVPQISFSMPFFDVLEPEVVAGLGLNATTSTLEMINRFSFGLRWFVPTAGAFDVDEPVRPFLWTALHHGHKVAAADVIKNPLGALLTSTTAGVGHLTGAEGGAGVLLALPIDGQSWPLLLRVGASWLPSFASVTEGHAGPDKHGDDVLLLVDVAVGLPLRLNR